MALSRRTPFSRALIQRQRGLSFDFDNLRWSIAGSSRRRLLLDGLQRGIPGAAQNSLLLNLPQELKDIIWTFALIEPRKEAYRTASILVHDGLTQPELLHTCRSIREETTPIYYSQNVFRGNSEDLFCWITSRPLPAQEHLKDLRLAVERKPTPGGGWEDLWFVTLRRQMAKLKEALGWHHRNFGRCVLRAYYTDWHVHWALDEDAVVPPDPPIAWYHSGGL